MDQKQSYWLDSIIESIIGQIKYATDGSLVYLPGKRHDPTKVKNCARFPWGDTVHMDVKAGAKPRTLIIKVIDATAPVPITVVCR
jgi:hypothetical protein